MPSDHLIDLCNSPNTVVSALEADPTGSPRYVAQKLFPKPKNPIKRILNKRHEDYTPQELDKVAKCGKFPYRPSDLFLKIYSDVLDTLEQDPLCGMTSPPLMGSSGIIPLSIISLIPDIMRYYQLLIANAQHEVIIATNYWEPSWASHFVHQGLLELSKNHEGRPTKPVVKLIYDRGNPKQVIKNHQPILPREWEDLGIPREDEIPHIHLEVMNYHRPIMGTFHAKYMVVDRKIAILNSNNIQDRVNLEQMTHLEGEIVQSFYDMALQSWAEPMNPPMPMLKDPNLRVTDLSNAWPDAERRKQEMYDRAAEAQPTDSNHAYYDGHTDYSLLSTEGFRPVFVHSQHEPVPIAMACRAPHGTPDHDDTHVPQDAAWLAGFRLAKKSILIQTPDFNNAVVEPILDACRRGVECTLYIDLGYNDLGENLPRQGGTNAKVQFDMAATLKKEGKLQYLKAFWYVGKDRDQPVDASKKERNCHVKFACIDNQVAILGNGNQDTQSWFHSQETNVMIDSPSFCAEFIETLNNNQNTALYGRLDENGEWRDKDGNLVESSGGKGGLGPTVKGFIGAIQRVRGKGGF